MLHLKREQKSFLAIPKPGATVRHPYPPFNPLPPEGARVPNNSFWRRRLKAGDIDIGLAKQKGEEKRRKAK